MPDRSRLDEGGGGRAEYALDPARAAAPPRGPISAEEAHLDAIERMRYVMARIVTAKTCLEELKSAGNSLAIHG